MSKVIMPEIPGSLQAWARATVDAEFSRRVSVIIHRALADVADLLFQRAEKVPESTTLADVRRLGRTDVAQTYEADALFVMRMRDPLRHQQAAYYAANAATPGGIGSLSRRERQAVVELFELSLRAYRDVLTNNAPPDVSARLGRLLEADQQTPNAFIPTATSQGVN